MKTILVVDDIKAIRESLALKLKQEGHEILQAENGKKGLKIAFEEKPDLIICDLLMPVMDGFEMVKSLRNDGKWGKNVKVIILTNLSPDNEVYNKMPEPKPIYYMVKSNWTLQELGAKVEEILGVED